MYGGVYLGILNKQIALQKFKVILTFPYRLDKLFFASEGTLAA